jgi:tetratricopeptide (TPR) repeat protein
MTKWLGVCVFVAVSVHVAPTRADDLDLDEPRATTAERPSEVARAEDYAAQAYDAYSQQDYASAVSLYRMALDAASSPDIIYNLARIYDTKLKDRPHAMEFYSRYTQDPGADPARAKVAASRLAALQELSRIQSGAARPSTNHAVPARPEAAAPPARTARSSSGVSGLTIASVIIGAIGLGGVGLGVAYGLDAKTKADVSHAMCSGNLCRTSRGVEITRQASNAATLSNIGFIAGGALVATSITLLIIGASRSDEAPLTAYVAPQGAGAQWNGRF